MHMKKILFTITAGMFCFFISCNSGSNTSAENKSNDAAQKNLAAANAVNKAIETGDVSNLGDYIAADGVDHAGMKGEVKGLDSIKAELAKIHTMAADMKMETIKELADSEYVFQWMRFTGTAATADMGMPAGTRFDMSAIEVSRFKYGKAIEHWEFMQPADMMKMMGPQQGMGNKKDTTMHK